MRLPGTTAVANSLLFLTTDLSCLTASMISHTCLREAGSRPVVGSSEGEREGGREGREGKEGGREGGREGREGKGRREAGREGGREELHLIAAVLAVNFKACDMQLSYTNLRSH